MQKNIEFVDDLINRLVKRAEIRRQIPDRKSVKNNEPDRIADLLEEAAYCITVLNNLVDYYKHTNCNGFCGEYECKENQANCKRIKK
jgi:hypothetical protein